MKNKQQDWRNWKKRLFSIMTDKYEDEDDRQRHLYFLIKDARQDVIEKEREKIANEIMSMHDKVITNKPDIDIQLDKLLNDLEIYISKLRNK